MAGSERFDANFLPRCGQAANFLDYVVNENDRISLYRLEE